MQERIRNINIDQLSSDTRERADRLFQAAITFARGRVNFDDPAHVDVFTSGDNWTPFPGMSGIETRVVEWDKDRRIIRAECWWRKSGFVPPHYHQEVEDIFVQNGAVVFWLEGDEGEIVAHEMETGHSLHVPSNVPHAAYVKAGTVYMLTFHPPIASQETPITETA